LIGPAVRLVSRAAPVSAWGDAEAWREFDLPHLPEPYESFISALLGWYDAVESRDLAQANIFADRVLVAGNRLAAEQRFIHELQHRLQGCDPAG
jgi:hypothetical protein